VVAHWEDAIRPNAPRIHEGFENVVAHLKHNLGDMDAALRDADFVIERRFENPKPQIDGDGMPRGEKGKCSRFS
jgi:hypothetical protein